MNIHGGTPERADAGAASENPGFEIEAGVFSPETPAPVPRSSAGESIMTREINSVAGVSSNRIVPVNLIVFPFACHFEKVIPPPPASVVYGDFLFAVTGEIFYSNEFYSAVVLSIT